MRISDVRAMVDYPITRHAVEQYRNRVLACPERARSVDEIESAIRWQIREYPMRFMNKCLIVSAGPWRQSKRQPWRLTLAYPTHMFVIDDGAVLTVLGFMMRPKKSAALRARRKKAQRYRERAAALRASL